MEAVLTPAYGRIYKSASEAIDAYKSGKDWIFHNPAHRDNGRYCSCRDFDEDAKLELRYGPQNQQAVIAAKGPVS